MYLEGRGVKQDSKNAFKWIRKAADCNLTIAFYYLGKLFENGTGVDKDEAQALRWYHKAASQNYPGATAKIANLESKLSARKEKQIPMAQPSADSPSKVVESFFYKSKKLSDSPVSYASSFVSLNSSEPLEKPSSKSSSPLLNAGRMEINLEILPEDLKLGKAISSGGFGTVYKGYHHGRKVAIKQLHAREMTENALLEFQREATIMMRLHSPSVVTLYGVTLNSPYYLVMEYMNGGSLYHLLQSNQDLNWKSRAKMALEIGQGLSFLHSRNILHRDLKSMNVLLDKLHRVKLGDFGLARVKQESSSQNTQRSMGTTSWMAPELFKRRAEYTKACDVYSLGMLLWELASRQIPFADAPDPGVIMTWVMQGNREAIPVGTPVWYSLLIQACWDAEPTKRPEIAEVVQQLEKGFAEEKAKAAGSVPQTAQPTPSTATSRLPGYLSNSQTSVPSYLSGVQGVQSNIENLYLSSAPVSTSGASYRALASGNASYLNLFGAHVTQGANSSFTNEAVSQTPPSP